VIRLSCNGNGLSLVLPTGSMEKPSQELFRLAGFEVITNGSRGYCGKINDPRFGEVKLLRPQDIPHYVADGKFCLGLTGIDWLAETGRQKDVIEVTKLPVTKNDVGLAKIVLCVEADSLITRAADIPNGSVVETEYPQITDKFFKDRGIEVKVKLSHGATEAKVPSLCDAVVELTETGSTLKKNNLKIIETLMTTTAVLIANRAAYNDHKDIINEITMLLNGVVNGRGRVLLIFHCVNEKLPAVLQHLPSLKKPTIVPLTDQEVAVFTVVPKETIRSDGQAGVNMIIPQIKKSGAEDICEVDVTKLVP